MIAVTSISNWTDPGNPDRTSRRPVRRIVVSTRNADRALAFYARVFGFHRAPARPTNPGLHVCLNALHLSLHVESLPTELALMPSPRRWAFAVADLDNVRAQVWELGVPVARDSSHPDQIYRAADAWSLFVRDPDGNEIELVERRSAARLPGATSVPRPNTVLANWANSVSKRL